MSWLSATAADWGEPVPFPGLAVMVVVVMLGPNAADEADVDPVAATRDDVRVSPPPPGPLGTLKELDGEGVLSVEETRLAGREESTALPLPPMLPRRPLLRLVVRVMRRLVGAAAPPAPAAGAAPAALRAAPSAVMVSTASTPSLAVTTTNPRFDSMNFPSFWLATLSSTSSTRIDSAPSTWGSHAEAEAAGAQGAAVALAAGTEAEADAGTAGLGSETDVLEAGGTGALDAAALALAAAAAVAAATRGASPAPVWPRCTGDDAADRWNMTLLVLARPEVDTLPRPAPIPVEVEPRPAAARKADMVPEWARDDRDDEELEEP